MMSKSIVMLLDTGMRNLNIFERIDSKLKKDTKSNVKVIRNK